MRTAGGWWAGLLIALAVLAGPVRPAAAEWFLDLYGGGSFTQDADVKFRGGTTVDDKVKFNTVGTGGGRFGYWLDLPGLPWLGVALDVSYFAPGASSTAINTHLEVVPISTLVMFRAPLLASPAFPHGQLQPYAAGGPSIFISHARIDTPATGERTTSDEADFGGDVRGGLAFLFTPHIGVFVEGRYTFFTTSPGGGNTDLDVETFQALGGLTFRW
jgi:hypothetical protein